MATLLLLKLWVPSIFIPERGACKHSPCFWSGVPSLMSLRWESSGRDFSTASGTRIRHSPRYSYPDSEPWSFWENSFEALWLHLIHLNFARTCVSCMMSNLASHRTAVQFNMLIDVMTTHWIACRKVLQRDWLQYYLNCHKRSVLFPVYHDCLSREVGNIQITPSDFCRV